MSEPTIIATEHEPGHWTYDFDQLQLENGDILVRYLANGSWCFEVEKDDGTVIQCRVVSA